MFDTEQFKKAVLNKAIRGELTNRLPEDGTADDLLKEIHDEKTILIEEGKIKKQKALPDIEDDEIPFGIPSNWKWVRLGDITYLNSGHNLNKIVTENGSINYAKVADMNSEGNEIEIITTKNTINDSKYTLPKGSIIFPKIGGAIKTNKRRIINNELTAIDPNIMSITPVVNGLFDFLYIYMKKIDLSKISFGTSMPSISKTNMNNLIFPLPPFAEQQRIVARIEKCFQFAEYIEKENELTKDFQIEMKKSLLQSAMKGDLTNQLPADGSAENLLKEIDDEKKRLIEEGKVKKQSALPDIEDDEIPFEIPSNWKWVRLAEIASIINGDRGKNYPGKQYWIDEGVPFLNAGSISNSGTIDNKSINYISEERFKLLRSGFIQKNDIIYTLRGSVGKSGIIKNLNRGAIASSIVIIRTIKSNPDFINKLFKSNLNDLFIKKFQNGSVQGNLSAKSLNNMLIPLPPLTEQQRIVEKLDELFSKLDD